MSHAEAFAVLLGSLGCTAACVAFVVVVMVTMDHGGPGRKN